MIEIIRPEKRGGYPAEYLVARLRGRHAARQAEWRCIATSGIPAGVSDDRIWGAFLDELQWLHAQMAPDLRAAAAPLFGLFELKTIVLGLRDRAVRRTAELERLLAHTLLHARIRDILLQPGDVAAVVAALSSGLAAGAPALRQLDAAYATGNLKGFENALMKLYLEDVAASRIAPPLDAFFVQFIDARNVMIVYKALRWGLSADAPFIAGGSIRPSSLQRIAASKEPAQLDALVASLTGIEASAAAASEPTFETVLLRTVTARLEQVRRDGGIGAIAAYTWRCYVQARNLAVLYHGVDIDPASLEQELIA